MKLNQNFRSRKDLEGWMICFENGETLEMSFVSAFLTELLRARRTRLQLTEWLHELFPAIDTDEEINHVLTTYNDLQLLEGN